MDLGFFPQRFVLKGESKVSFNEFGKMEVILIRSVFFNNTNLTPFKQPTCTQEKKIQKV